jgi:hypothetical protein
MKKIFFVLGFELGRPFIGPPAMPHVARWVRAHDEGLRAAGCGAEEKVGFGSSRRCRTGVVAKEVMIQPAEVIERIKNFLAQE